jgi:TonB family protein
MQPMNAASELQAAGTPELHLLLDWQRPAGTRGVLLAGLGSILLHVVGLTALTLLPAGGVVVRDAPRFLAAWKNIPLVAPPAELTQKTPNRSRVSKEFDLQGLLARPPLTLPPAAPSTTRPAASQVLPEPPQVDDAARLPQLAQALGASPAPPLPPVIQAQENPKLVFEKPGSPAGTAGRVLLPKTSLEETGRALARGGGAGGLVVGDLGEGVGGMGEGLNLPPAPGRSASSLELLSDPMGVDFKPYLIRILSAVRRNWFAVIPESARLGRRGKVLIQFAISRNGYVPKLVIAVGSGTEALDRAAVAGISASNPFPPLPAEFRGNQVRLQFTFAYNTPVN